MTVINPNSVAGINSITVQSGNSLSVHKANGELIRTITSSSGVSTFSTLSVGTATTDNSAAKSINIGLGASISQHDDNTLTFGTNGDPQVVLGATGHLVFPNNGKGVVFGATSGSNRPSITGSYTSSSNNHLVLNVTGEERLRIQSDGDVGIGTIDNSNNERLRIQDDASTSTVCQVSIISGNAERAILNFGDAEDPNIGRVTYHNNTNALSLFTDNTERLLIDSSGRVGIQGDPTRALLEVRASGGSNTMLTALFGANEGTTAGTLSDNTDKACRMGIHHYDTDALPFGLLVASAGASQNALNFGGGTSLMNAATQIQFTTGADTTTANGTTRMIINSGGQVLMGGTDAYANFENSSTNPRLQVRGTDLNGSCQAWVRATADAGAPKLFLANTRNTSGNGHTIVQNGDELGGIFFAGSDGSQFVNGAAIVANVDESPGADDMPGRLDLQTTPNGSTTLATRMRFEESGDIRIGNYGTLFGSTGITIFQTPQVQISRADGNPVLINRNGTDGDIVEFRKGWGAGGTIDIATNSVTYNTSSDYRLKENIVAITDGITRLKTLKPSRFNWIGDTSSTRDGFIAHEVTAVPEAISGTKDQTYTEDDSSRNIKAGDPKYQGIDQSKLVPLLTAALQEAITKIETLETKVAALEGG